MLVDIRHEVAVDLADAANWYDGQESGLGDDFMQMYRGTLNAVVESPYSGPSSALDRVENSLPGFHICCGIA